MISGKSTFLCVHYKGIQGHLCPQAETTYKAVQITPGVQLAPGICVLLKQAQLWLLELLAQCLFQLAHGILHPLHATRVNALPALRIDIAVKKLFYKSHSFRNSILYILYMCDGCDTCDACRGTPY